MLDFIKTNMYSIIVAILFIGFLFYLYYNKNIELLKKIMLGLVVEAEKKLGSGTGDLKYSMVVIRLYELLPKIMKILLTRKQLDLMIKEAVDFLKEYLGDNKNLLSYNEEVNK